MRNASPRSCCACTICDGQGGHRDLHWVARRQRQRGIRDSKKRAARTAARNQPPENREATSRRPQKKRIRTNQQPTSSPRNHWEKSTTPNLGEKPKSLKPSTKDSPGQAHSHSSRTGRTAHVPTREHRFHRLPEELIPARGTKEGQLELAFRQEQALGRMKHAQKNSSTR